MPLAFGSLLGGLTTLVGIPPNILVTDALRNHGLETFRLFDFTPVGMAVMLAGIVFMTFVGRHLLPSRHPAKETSARKGIALDTALDLNLTPQALMMTVAMSASASFMSPVAHPANVLVVGPGGYRFSDYTKVGVLLTVVCLLVVFLFFLFSGL